MMNLEVAEQKCLKYLKGASNPLVPVSLLLRHVRKNDECSSISEHELLDFLRNHELFKVIDPLDICGVSEEPEGLALVSEPRAILCTRVPTQDQLNAMMYDQLDTMIEALLSALKESQEDGKTDLTDKIKDALERSEKLRKKLEHLLTLQ